MLLSVLALVNNFHLGDGMVYAYIAMSLPGLGYCILHGKLLIRLFSRIEQVTKAKISFCIKKNKIDHSIICNLYGGTDGHC
jgi:hypothetical protein